MRCFAIGFSPAWQLRGSPFLSRAASRWYGYVAPVYANGYYGGYAVPVYAGEYSGGGCYSGYFVPVYTGSCCRGGYW